MNGESVGALPDIAQRTVRVPLEAAGAAPDGPLAPYPRCGSKGVNVHQRDWKAVKDPHCSRALVVRYLCKRCGHVRRVYPEGFGPSRQSEGLKQLSVLLYCLGLSYQTVRSVLLDLNCPLSTTSIRRNVLAAGQAAGVRPPSDRLQLSPLGEGMVEGPDGRLVVRLVGT